MKTSFLLNNLKSHPDKLLKDHLFNVGKYCKDALSLKRLKIENIDFDVLQNVAYLIGVSHDFGKATSYFQNYINETDETKRVKLKNKPETHHGVVSSIFTYYVLREYLSTKNLLDKKYYEYLPVIGFLVVKRHHGNLQNADDEVIFDEEDKEILERQITSINFEELNEIYDFLLSRIDIDFDCNLVKDKILHSESVDIYGKQESRKDYEKDLSREEKRRIRNIDEEHTLFFYFIAILLYSILLNADKKDAANLEKIKRVDINENIVDEYKELRFGNKEDKNKKINKMRNEIYEEVISNAERIDLDKDKILSLNVPTGTGKTLTSLSFALKLRERIKKERGVCPRIIYSLPFLSIIDQNSKEFAKVLAPLGGVSWESLLKMSEIEQEKILAEKIPSSLLLEHHHLSDLVYKTEDEFENAELEKNVGKSLLLIEGWNSEIIVTTFMQFFYSLISNRNRMIRKFHNMINSIVILDEVQAIPHRYWLLLKESIRFFAEHFNTYFIFVTATQPLIFDEKKNEIKSLIGNKKQYFDAFDRIDLIPSLTPLKIEDFKVILQKEILQSFNKNFLIVMNTIDSSKEIYGFIKNEMIREIGDTKIYYLSTNLVPKERLKRIKEIKKKSEKRKIIVSTQLIEAGVDIDVDVVYRDFGPLDSINQAAGRCNRNFGENKGIVKIFILKKENGAKEYYTYIYDGFIMSKTKNVFMGNNLKIITESKFLDLNDTYFKQIKEGQSEDDSKSILDHVKKLEFADLSEFKLIKDEPYKVDVFVELDDEAEKIWHKFDKIINNKELKGFEKRREFLKIKKKFYEYVISVDNKKAERILNSDLDVGYVSKEYLEKYYDLETGFKGDSGAWTI